MKISKVMCFGTFDILHKGHLNYFKQAKKLGKKLVVVVARASNVFKMKKRKPMFNERIRLKQVSILKIVDKAILGDKKDIFKVIEKEKPDLICLGYDQQFNIKKIKEELKRRNLKVKIKRLKPYKPDIFKSSLLKWNTTTQ